MKFCNRPGKLYSPVSGTVYCEDCAKRMPLDDRRALLPFKASARQRGVTTCASAVALSLNQHSREVCRRSDKVVRLVAILTTPGLVDDDDAPGIAAATARNARMAARSAAVLLSVDAWTVIGERVRAVDLDYDGAPDAKVRAALTIDAYNDEECLAAEMVDGIRTICRAKLAEYEHRVGDDDLVYAVCPYCEHHAVVYDAIDAATVIEYFYERDAAIALLGNVPDDRVVVKSVIAKRALFRLDNPPPTPWDACRVGIPSQGGR